jgi:hypothetical protein|nr:MAG TPA: hypothetical protein [Caudoviricetes sp.]
MITKCLPLLTVGYVRKIARSGNIDRIEELSRHLTGFVSTDGIRIRPLQVIWMDKDMQHWPSNKRLHVDDVIQCIDGARLYTPTNAFYRSGREESYAILMMGKLYDAAMDYVHWKCHDPELTIYASDYLFGWKWSGQIDLTPLAMAKDAIGYAKWVRNEMKQKGFCR